MLSQLNVPLSLLKLGRRYCAERTTSERWPLPSSSSRSPPALENRAEDQFDQVILCFRARKCASCAFLSLSNSLSPPSSRSSPPAGWHADPSLSPRADLVQHQDKLEIILIILIVVLFIIMAASPAVLSPAARLPVELVEMICNELAFLGQHTHETNTAAWFFFWRPRDLAAAARISRKWAGPAQTALLRSLFLDSPD